MMRVAFLPVPGLVTDETSFSIPNRCSDANGVRWKDGRPEPVGGWVKAFGDQLSGVCRNVLTWYDLESALNIALGTHTHLYVQKNGVLTDITPPGLPAGAENGAPGGGFGSGDYGEGDYGEGDLSSPFPRTWSFANWGQALLANPRGRTLYIWENNVANDATEIVNAPDQINSIIVTPERQVLALGCNQADTTFNPLCIRGSNLRDYTAWAIAVGSNAFEHILSGGGSRIVSGDMVGDYVAVWTDQALFMGQFIGATDQIYRFDLQALNCGLIGPNAKVVINKRAYWITPDFQIYTWAPGEAPSLLPCPIRDDFKDNVTQPDKIAGASISQYGELWWFYPDSRDGFENSRAIFVNANVPMGAPPQWSKWKIARSAAIDAGATANPLFVSPDGYVYSHENGQTANGGSHSGHYTISLPYLDEGGRFVMIDAVEPDFKDQAGPLWLTFTMRKYPNSVGYPKGPFTLSPGQTRRHFRLSGRSGDIKVSWDSSPAFHRLGKPVLHAMVAGEQ